MLYISELIAFGDCDWFFNWIFYYSKSESQDGKSILNREKWWFFAAFVLLNTISGALNDLSIKAFSGISNYVHKIFLGVINVHSLWFVRSPCLSEYSKRSSHGDELLFQKMVSLKRNRLLSYHLSITTLWLNSTM